MTCIYCNIFHCYLQYNVPIKYKNCNTKIAVDFSLNENVCIDYYEKKNQCSTGSSQPNKKSI